MPLRDLLSDLEICGGFLTLPQNTVEVLFLLIYVILAVTFGFALMITEIALGRKTGKSALYAFSTLHEKCGFIGILASIVPIIILPYYCVIGGWVIKFAWAFLTGSGNAAAADDYFSNFYCKDRGTGDVAGNFYPCHFGCDFAWRK